MPTDLRRYLHSGIAAPACHPLRAAVTRHKARLSAELTKIRIKRGVRSIEELRSQLSCIEGPDDVLGAPTPGQNDRRWPHPRWVRINTLKTGLEEQLSTAFVDYEKVLTLEKVLFAKLSAKILCVDGHVPDLIALPAGSDLTKTAAYRNGLIILQDKASCFPALLLDPTPEQGTCLDACAAPGNKTTHLAAIFKRHSHDHPKARILACEKDKARAETLKSMVNLAGCRDMVTVKAGQDFLLLDPGKAPWKDVGSLLLDPSCSGSGIVGRDKTLAVTLPIETIEDDAVTKTRKRKRGKKLDVKLKSKGTIRGDIVDEEGSLGTVARDEEFQTRLKALSAFQLRLLLHAFRFPSAQRISYSTCSIYPEENEQVVITALNSTIANECGWRLLRRDEQVAGMESWSTRGEIDAFRGLGEYPTDATEFAEACIRCGAGTEDGTQGFFVAAFIRDSMPAATSGKVDNHQVESLESLESSIDPSYADITEEWEGLSSDGD
ncbi:MAG: hypothetical protein Q9184_007354 [Pyrenodesmia sp. 2 TL-2023]